MPTRTAQTSWTGTLEQGSGVVDLVSSRQGTFDVSYPKRVADEAGAATSPEELVGAAHSACYAMALTGALGANGFNPASLSVRADVTLGPDKADAGFKLTSIVLTVRAAIDDVDDAVFQRIAEEAKAACPLSKALASVDITLDAQLES